MTPTSLTPPRALALAAASLAFVLSAAPARADVQRTIVAVGVATAKPTPQDRKSNDSIKAAVEAAEAQALPEAIREGHEYAEKLANAAGVTLGDLLTISNAPTSPYGPFGYQFGPFGPDQYCGNRSVPIVRREANGRRRVVGRRTRHVCIVPRQIVQQVTVTYAIAS
ncbi:MAG TPA: hypothetical protein VGJ32_13280 [Solirubrobacteraceae bacterium]|jgi:hypothetical protein